MWGNIVRAAAGKLPQFRGFLPTRWRSAGGALYRRRDHRDAVGRELLGLEWSNVNLDQGYVQVTHILNEVHGKLKIKEPKTASSRRRIDLPQIAIDALRKHRLAMVVEGHESKFVFVNEHGNWWRRRHFHSQCFKPLLAKAGLPKIRFHDLRHTCATLLLQDDVHPKVVQERLGHSKISITLDTYSHVMPTMQQAASESFDKMFRKR